MKYLKYLQTANDFESFKNSEDYVLPNVSYVVETEDVYMEPYVAPPPTVGDIVYKSSGQLKTIAPNNWDSSLGTPVGIIVISPDFTPDGKARMISLKWASTSSTSSNSLNVIKWGVSGVNTSLPDFDEMPTTFDNNNSATIYYKDKGYLPSDAFGSVASYIDPIAKYDGYSPYLPSPYSGSNPNPVYHNNINGTNALSDLNGKGNTDVLVALGSNYFAANAARNYKAVGAEEIEWYLPAMGELGYMIARFNKIQESLTLIKNACSLQKHTYWSSTESDSLRAFYVNASTGEVSIYAGGSGKVATYCVRPFAIID